MLNGFNQRFNLSVVCVIHKVAICQWRPLGNTFLQQAVQLVCCRLWSVCLQTSALFLHNAFRQMVRWRLHRVKLWSRSHTPSVLWMYVCARAPSYSHINNTCYPVHLTVSGFIESPLENVKIDINQGDVCLGVSVVGMQCVYCELKDDCSKTIFRCTLKY